MKEQYKKELEILMSDGKKNGFVSISKINELFGERVDELLPNIIKALKDANIKITIKSDNIQRRQQLIKTDVLNKHALRQDRLLEIESNNQQAPQAMAYRFFEYLSVPDNEQVKIYLRKIEFTKTINLAQQIQSIKSAQEGKTAEEEKEQVFQGKIKITNKELHDLNKKIEKRKEACEQLVAGFSCLIALNASQYVNMGISFADLIQISNASLIKAVYDCEPSGRNNLYRTAQFWILQAMINAFSPKKITIKMTKEMFAEISKLNEMTLKFTYENHRDPTIEEMAQKMGVSCETIKHMQAITQYPFVFTNHLNYLNAMKKGRDIFLQLINSLKK